MLSKIGPKSLSGQRDTDRLCENVPTVHLREPVYFMSPALPARVGGFEQRMAKGPDGT